MSADSHAKDAAPKGMKETPLKKVEEEASKHDPRNPHGQEERTIDAQSRRQGTPEQMQHEDDEK